LKKDYDEVREKATTKMRDGEVSLRLKKVFGADRTYRLLIIRQLGLWSEAKTVHFNSGQREGKGKKGREKRLN